MALKLSHITTSSKLVANADSLECIMSLEAKTQSVEPDTEFSAVTVEVY